MGILTVSKTTGKNLFKQSWVERWLTNNLYTFNAEGKQTADLGTGKNGSGLLTTFNKHEVMTGYFGTDKDNDGVIGLYDRYGDGGWYESGKK